MNAVVETRHSKGVTILDVSGDVVLGDGTEALRETVRGLVTGGIRRVVVNLAGVQHMDSSGIGELLATRTALLNRGGQMKLLRPSRRVVEVLQITKIYNTFDIFEDEAAALGSFRQIAADEASAG